MKQKFILLFIIIIFLQFKNYAQESVSVAAAREAATINLRNTVLTINNQNFDYRILKHYTEQEINNMSDIKRNQILFIYTQSYRVINLESCTSLLPVDIDVSKIDIFRLENSTTTVSYGTDCKVQVELISRNALQQKLDELNK